MKQPRKWKMAIVIWLAIYPLITIVNLAFGKYLILIEPMALRTLVLTAILVPVMVYLLIPFISRLFTRWLRR